MANFINPYNYYNPYQPYSTTPIQTPATPTSPTPPTQTNSNSIIWVQGENGAKSYLVAPNTTVLLMDSESKKFYLKSADNSGMPLPLRTFEYTEIVNTAPTTDFSNKTDKDIAYITKEQFDGINGKIDAIKKDVDKLLAKKSTKKEVADDE